MTRDSYDDRQVVNAKLVTCMRCAKSWYMTVPHALCVECEWPTTTEERRDINGVEMTDP